MVRRDVEEVEVEVEMAGDVRSKSFAVSRERREERMAARCVDGRGQR